MGEIITIRPGQLGAFVKKSAPRTAEAVKRGIQNGLRRGMAHMVRQTPVDQGILKNAWKVIVASDGGSALINDAPHAGIVERGARPHMPPLEPILEWVKRHLRNFGIKSPTWKGSSKAMGSGKGYAARAEKVRAHVEKVAEFEDDVLAIAEAIRWKIAKHGQAPTWFVKSNLPQLRALVQDEVEKAVAGALGMKSP